MPKLFYEKRPLVEVQLLIIKRICCMYGHKHIHNYVYLHKKKIESNFHLGTLAYIPNLPTYLVRIIIHNLAKSQGVSTMRFVRQLALCYKHGMMADGAGVVRLKKLIILLPNDLLRL